MTFPSLTANICLLSSFTTTNCFSLFSATGSVRNDCHHFGAMYRAQFSIHILGSYRKLKPKDAQIDWQNHIFDAAIFGAKIQTFATVAREGIKI